MGQNLNKERLKTAILRPTTKIFRPYVSSGKIKSFFNKYQKHQVKI